MSDPANHGGVTVTTAHPPDVIDRLGKVVGHICANEHPRIAYYEVLCPMCLLGAAFVEAETQLERLKDEASYRQHELESARDRIAELEDEKKS